MKLSDKAIQDLKETLKNTFGEGFLVTLDDDGINEIGLLLLTTLTEGLKNKIRSI